MGEQVYETNDKYILPRDDSELLRLNGQHVYLKKCVYDERLIFDESIKLCPGDRVLDSGTGTGVWLLDLATETPETIELQGVDISPINFPMTYPPNVHFEVASITRLPAEWTGRFNFVNQRLLIAALPTVDWPIVLAEIYRVLKPGGHVQFAEIDYQTLIGGGPVSDRWCAIRLQLYKHHGLMANCGMELPRMLGDAGFVNILSEQRCPPIGKLWGEMGEYGIRSNVSAWRNMGPSAVEAGLFQTREEHENLMVDLENELNERKAQCSYRLICAQKP